MRNIEITRPIRPNGSHSGGEVTVQLDTPIKDGTVQTPIGGVNIRRQEEPPGYLLRGAAVGISLTAANALFVPDMPHKPGDAIRTSQGSINKGGQVVIKDFLG